MQRTDSDPMSPPASNDRLRFAEFSLERLPNGRCRSRVLLTWLETERFTGESEGLASQAGELRCAAQACVNALTQAVQDGMGFELLGVKAVRAFDANVVIVSVLARREGAEQRLLGCHLADEDSLRSAVLATLQATNRILGAAISGE